MAEFTGKIGTPSDGFTLKVVYSYTQSVAKNTSTLTATGYVKRNNSTYYPYNTTSSVVLKIDGKTYNFSPSYNLNTNNYVKICTKTVTITHGADGKKSVPISLKMDGKLSSYYPNGTISKTISLTTIPRATTPTLSATSIAMGSSVTITTNRASSSFTHTISYTFGATTGTIASSVGTSVSWAVPLSLANQVPSAESGTCTITCQTYNGSTLIGTKTINLTLTVPSSVMPVINSVTISEAGTTPQSWGVYVKNKSKLKVVTNASGSYSSTIQSYKITGIDGNTYTSSNFTSATLTKNGSYTIKVEVTDSRRRTVSKDVICTCVDYANPIITKATAIRCNSDGTANEEGTYLKYTFEGSVSSVNNKNTYVYKIGYKLANSSTYTYVTILNDAYSINKANVVLSNITFSENNSYNIQFYIGDYFTNTTVVQNIATGFTLMDFNSSGKSMAIGKVSEANSSEGLLEIAVDTVFDKNVTFKGNTVLTKNNVVNNLMSTNISEPLSAYQGKLLNDTKVTQGDKSIVNTSSGNKSYIVLGNLLMCWGEQDISPKANTPTNLDITFPKKFSTIPCIHVTPDTSVPRNASSWCINSKSNSTRF